MYLSSLFYKKISKKQWWICKKAPLSVFYSVNK